ncbi:hypothetical protein BS50DRAFT_475139, partial [Corynespora cassiicola Philippines]
MNVPKPAYPLDGHCTVIHDGTLYAYSSAGFQSLGLEEGAKWKKEPMDISLTGAQCVKAVPGGDAKAAKLYIVGGSPNETASTWDYPGLMHYTFATKKWDWVRAESWVTQNRKNHAAIYLNESKDILVYSGAQSDDTGPSSSTFLINTEAPYAVRGFPAADAPPSVQPMLMPWDDSHAVMVGGSTSNTAVFTFSPSEGWMNVGVTLEEPIANQDQVQCAVVSGDDGSRVLEMFDMGKSPNEVRRVALLTKGGKPAAPGTMVGEQSSGDKTKRVTIQDWPAYNSTYASTVTRSKYSLAQDENGLAVVSGGSTQDPLCVFDQQANAWMNTTALFAQEQAVIQSTPSSTSTASPTSSVDSTAAASASVTAAAAPAAVNNKSKMLTVLGATLGTIFGIAAILILLLFCLKYRKAKNKKAQQSGYVEKDRLSFADRGADFMHEAGGSISQTYPKSGNESTTSLAIISGKGGSHKRGLGPMGSDASTAGLVTKKSPLGYSEPMEMSKFDLKPEPIEERIVRQNSGRVPPAANVSRSRSSGWSKYFANNEATNLANMPSDRSTFASERTSTGSQSMYTNSKFYSQAQTIPPLQIPNFDGQRLSKVATGSPTLGNSQENLPHQPMQAELGRANSNGSVRSVHSRNDDYARAPVESWTPVGDYDRPPSSAYTGSMVIEDRRDAASSYYPDNTSSFYPKSNYSSFYPGGPRLGEPIERNSTVTVFPGSAGDMEAKSKDQSNLSTYYPSVPVPRAPFHPERESTVTVFPGQRDGAQGGKPPGEQD